MAASAWWRCGRLFEKVDLQFENTVWGRARLRAHGGRYDRKSARGQSRGEGRFERRRRYYGDQRTTRGGHRAVPENDPRDPSGTHAAVYGIERRSPRNGPCDARKNAREPQTLDDRDERDAAGLSIPDA